MTKRYYFIRAGVLAHMHLTQEAAVKEAKTVQEWDHKIGDDYTTDKHGTKKAVVYKVEEYARVHAWESYSRTYNDTILEPLPLAVPARLDADGTAKGINKIAAHVGEGHCYYGVKPFHHPELVVGEGQKIPLYKSN